MDALPRIRGSGYPFPFHTLVCYFTMTTFQIYMFNTVVIFPTLKVAVDLQSEISRVYGRLHGTWLGYLEMRLEAT
jgi:hypothetical protein